MSTGHLLTCPLLGLQAFVGLEGQPRILEDPRVVLPAARRTANVRLLHYVPDLRVGTASRQADARPAALHPQAAHRPPAGPSSARPPGRPQRTSHSVLRLDSELCPLPCPSPTWTLVLPCFHLQPELQPTPMTVSILTSPLDPQPTPLPWLAPAPCPPPHNGPPPTPGASAAFYPTSVIGGGVPFSESTCSSYSAQRRPCPQPPAPLGLHGYPRF